MPLLDVPLLLFADSGHLEAANIAQLGRTSHAFHTAAADNALWQAIVCREWPSAVVLESVPKGYRHLYMQLLSSMKCSRRSRKLPPPKARADDFVLLIDLRLNNIMQWSVPVTGDNLAQLLDTGTALVNVSASEVGRIPGHEDVVDTVPLAVTVMAPYSRESGMQDTSETWEGSFSGWECRAHLMRKADQSVVCLMDEDEAYETVVCPSPPLDVYGAAWERPPAEGETTPDLAEYIEFHFQDAHGTPTDRRHFGRRPGMRELCFAIGTRLRVPNSPMKFAYMELLDSLGEEELRRFRDEPNCAGWRKRLRTAWSSLTHAQRREALGQAKQQYEDGTPNGMAETGDEDDAEDSDSCSCASEGWGNGVANLTLDFLDLQFWMCHDGHNEQFVNEEDGLSILHFLDGVHWEA